MTRRALRTLEADDRVKILAVISKPPEPEVAERLHRDLQELSKPVVACLLGRRADEDGTVQYAPTLTDAADAILSGLGKRTGRPTDRVPTAASRPRSGTVYGLFAGGTLCSEAALVLGSLGAPHHLIDLGADEYTRGRAHPMIDPRLRASMLADLGRREDVGVVLLDVILGDLAHPDPAGALLPEIEELWARGVPVVIALIGTRADPQGLEGQRAKLERAGALVYASNASAARLAAALVGGTA
jgi:FdrA protein